MQLHRTEMNAIMDPFSMRSWQSEACSSLVTLFLQTGSIVASYYSVVARGREPYNCRHESVLYLACRVEAIEKGVALQHHEPVNHRLLLSLQTLQLTSPEIGAP
jgi:hypothetical protein